MSDLDNDTVSTWHVYKTADGWHAEPCDPVEDRDLDVLLAHNDGDVVRCDGHVIAETAANAATRAAMLAKRQGVAR